jgi:hypothetical protein
MLQHETQGPRSRAIDRALLAAAFISFCFGLLSMLAGLLR